MSLITQVILRKDDSLYINDGVYGSFDELTLPGWTAGYHHKVYTLDAKSAVLPLGDAEKPFRVYGPTCDTLDVLPRPLMLPSEIAAGISSSSRTWAPIRSRSARRSTASIPTIGRSSGTDASRNTNQTLTAAA